MQYKQSRGIGDCLCGFWTLTDHFLRGNTAVPRDIHGCKDFNIGKAGIAIDFIIEDILRLRDTLLCGNYKIIVNGK